MVGYAYMASLLGWLRFPGQLVKEAESYPHTTRRLSINPIRGMGGLDSPLPYNP